MLLQLPSANVEPPGCTVAMLQTIGPPGVPASPEVPVTVSVKNDDTGLPQPAFTV